MRRWDIALEDRLRRQYTAPPVVRERDEPVRPRATAVGAGDGFAVQVAGRTIVTAPARSVRVGDELPEAMRHRWEAASGANPYYTWIQGHYVEADKANLNGHIWTAADLAVGSSTVRHGPLNWAHETRRVLGTIADNALIAPAAATSVVATVGSGGGGAYPTSASTAVTYTNAAITARWQGQLAYTTQHLAAPSAQERPYIAVVCAIWPWVAPGEAKAVQIASDAGQLWLSMECVAREVGCATDGDRVGCGATYPYVQAVTQPDTMCEHLRAGTSGKRMIDPSFMGGGVVVPPRRPGWPGAHAEIMRQAATLAEQVAPPDAISSEWEQLMAAVLAYATSTPAIG